MTEDENKAIIESLVCILDALSLLVTYIEAEGPLEKDIKEALKKHIQSTQKMLEEVKR